MNYFFDTSALVKHFCKEKGSEVVTKIILESSNIMSCPPWGAGHAPKVEV